MNLVDILIIILYFAAMILIGLYANKKHTSSDDYYVGGRSLSALKIGTLWLAGWIGGSSVIGTSANAFQLGISGAWYVVGIGIGCIIFGLTMAGPVKRVSGVFNSITFPQLITNRYDQRSGTMASITTLLAMIGYTASQFVAGAAILNVLTGWSLSVCYILAAVVIVFYVSTGGLLAVTYTDVVQMALLLFGLVALAVPLSHAYLSNAGMSLHTGLPASYFDISSWGWGTIIAMCISTIMSFFTSMDGFTRCIAAKNERAAKFGTLIAAALVIVIATASTYLGMAGKLILPASTDGNNVVAALVVKIFPHGIKGLVLIGVLSAIMSTADISVLTGSATFSEDIYRRYFNPEASDKKILRIGFIASLGVGVLGALLGWYMKNIMNILMITFTINSAGLFLPTIGCFFWKKSCSAAAFVSMLSATVIAVIWFIGAVVSNAGLFQINALWPSFGISAVLYFVICLTHSPSQEEQENAEVFYAGKH